MRVLLLVAVVALLALPAVALAASPQPSGSTTAAAAKKKPKKPRKVRKTKPAGSQASSTADEREAKGPIVALDPLTVGTLACAVPTTVSVAGFAVGDTVEMTCDLVGGVWTLRKLKAEADAPAAPGSAGGDEGELEVKGTLASLSPLQVGSTICVVPAAMSLAGFEVGQTVELECRLVDGVLTATKLKREDDGDDNQGESSGKQGSGDRGSSSGRGSDDGRDGSGGGGDDD